MCTPSIFTRFVRWRVRDFSSCFLACKFPLEEAPAETNRSPSPIHPTGNIVFESKSEIGDKKINKRPSRRNRCDNHRRQGNPNPRMLDDESGNSSCPCFSDEEYIVFCFKEDGDFDVIEDGNISEESNQSITSSWPVNVKLDCAEDAERNKQSNDEGTSNEDGNEGDINAAKYQGDREISSICWEPELASGSVRRRHQVDETPNRGTVSAESSDSKQSDSSTGSFAFPVLGWEWKGSPVQMPKSEGINTRRNKAFSVRFQCFRF